MLERTALKYYPIIQEVAKRMTKHKENLPPQPLQLTKSNSQRTKPFDGEAATVGNGTMGALQAQDRDQVQRLYDIALVNGGTSEGEPGPRGEPDANGMVFYAAYFRDPDGNKLNAFLMDKVA